MTRGRKTVYPTKSVSSNGKGPQAVACAAGVVGMGLMGSSIAACLLAAGHTVAAVEVDPAKLRKAPGRPTTERITVDVGRELCLRTGSKALLGGKRQSKHRVDECELCRLLTLSGPSCWGEGCQTMQAHAC